MSQCHIKLDKWKLQSRRNLNIKFKKIGGVVLLNRGCSLKAQMEARVELEITLNILVNFFLFFQYYLIITMTALLQYNLVFSKQHYKQGKYTLMQFSDNSMNSYGFKIIWNTHWFKNTWPIKYIILLVSPNPNHWKVIPHNSYFIFYL